MIKSLLFFRISNHNRLLVITEKLLAKYIRLFLTDSQKYGSVLKNSIDEYPANSVYWTASDILIKSLFCMYSKSRIQLKLIKI